MFTFTDLFAGVGGFHIALHALGGKLVSAIEIDEKARKTYELNFREGNESVFEGGKFFKDIRNVSAKDMPDHDILCAGFPCQAFSIAGYRKGFDDERGNLFFDLHRLIKGKKPSVIILENVKNLKGHDKGKTFKIIEESLRDIGYEVDAKVLNSCEYGGVPQNRERVYIVGFLNKQEFERFSFPESKECKLTVKDMLERKVDDYFYYNDKPLYEKLKDNVKEEGVVYQRRRVYVRENKSGVFPTLTANMGTGGHNVPIIKEKRGIRKLTPRECFSVQGFPKDFRLPDLAKSHLYKQAGNAVTVGVVYAVAKKILEAKGISYDINNTSLLSKKIANELIPA